MSLRWGDNRDRHAAAPNTARPKQRAKMGSSGGGMSGRRAAEGSRRGGGRREHPAAIGPRPQQGAKWRCLPLGAAGLSQGDPGLGPRLVVLVQPDGVVVVHSRIRPGSTAPCAKPGKLCPVALCLSGLVR